LKKVESFGKLINFVSIVWGEGWDFPLLDGVVFAEKYDIQDSYSSICVKRQVEKQTG